MDLELSFRAGFGRSQIGTLVGGVKDGLAGRRRGEKGGGNAKMV